MPVLLPRGRARPESPYAMKKRQTTDRTGGADSPAGKRRRSWRILWLVLLGLALLVGVGRAMLPRVARDYVNRTLDRNPLYAGKIGQVQIHLWRGAYSIHDVRI